MKDTTSKSKLAMRAVTIELDAQAKAAAKAAGVPLIEGYALVMRARDQALPGAGVQAGAVRQ